MKRFSDIEPDRIKTLEEYLSSIESDIQRNRISSMFQIATSVFVPINIRYGTSFDIPTIRISSNPLPSAQGMDGMIEISKGLVEHCLATRFGAIEQILGNRSSLIFSSEMIADAALIWIMAHEYFHIIRMHTTVLDERGNNRDDSHSIEHDADLCAIGFLFRIFQSHIGDNLSDLEIRLFTLYTIFWSIRTLPNSNEHSTHTPTVERLYHIATKLATIAESEGPGHPLPDNNFSLPRTREYLAKLIECLTKCEIMFHEIDEDKKFGDFIPDLRKILDGISGGDVVAKWNAIKEDVARISSTKTS